MLAKDPTGGRPQTRPSVKRSNEPSAWLRSTAAKKARKIRKRFPNLPADTAVVTQLGPSCRPGSREDFTCDRCRRYCPGGLNAGVHRHGGISFAFGLCDDCYPAENFR